MKLYYVGNVYTFWADDEDHAIEQYHNSMHQLDAAEANYVREVEE